MHALPTAGFKTLPAAAQADTRRRMARCGLAASLDHTLRLTYSVQDIEGVGQTAIANDLGKASLSVSRDMEAVLKSLPPPMVGQDAEGQGGGQAAGPQLGLLLTLSKRAAVAARALEVGAGAAAARGDGAAGAQQQSTEGAAEVLALLTAAAVSVERDVHDRAVAEAASGVMAVGASGADDAASGGVGCVDEAHEALALAARAVSSLATALAWRLAADVGTPAAGGPASQDSVGLPVMLQVVHSALGCAMRWWRRPLLLPLVQLLACQPHRLLAAVCALAVALPDRPRKLGKHKQRLCALVASAAAVLASHETLSGRVRRWLAPPPAAATATAGDPDGDGSGVFLL